MGDAFSFPVVPDATPLSEEAKLGLLPTHIVSISQLNEWEQMNITLGEQWAFANRRSKVISEPFFCNLHRRMFSLTWKWAGEYRRSDTSIGLPYYGIQTSLRDVVEDVNYWIQNRLFPLDDIAIMLHHRIVKVHPFANGNGRHARLLADVFLYQHGIKRLTWGGGRDLRVDGSVRAAYIRALKEADNLNYGPLLTLAKN